MGPHRPHGEVHTCGQCHGCLTLGVTSSLVVQKPVSEIY